MSNPPKWAQDLTLDALMYLQSKGFKPEIPELRWRRSRWHTGTSGVCYQHKYITVTAGKERRDQKLVLLHELAHWVLPDNEHHGDNFWRLAFDLYRTFGLPTRACINREALSHSSQPRSKERIKRLAKGG